MLRYVLSLGPDVNTQTMNESEYASGSWVLAGGGSTQRRPRPLCRRRLILFVAAVCPASAHASRPSRLLGTAAQQQLACQCWAALPN